MCWETFDHLNQTVVASRRNEMLYLVVCCRHYYSNILFPHHLPEIRNSVLHRALGRNVMIRSSAHVQLQGNHSAQMQFNAR